MKIAHIRSEVAHARSPCRIVAGRDNDQRSNIAFFLHKLIVDPVDKRYLSRSVVPVVCVVKQDTELADAEVIELFILLDQSIKVCVVKLQCRTRMDRPAEVEIVLMSRLCKLGDLLCLVLRIKLFPVRPVIRIVLGRIDVCIHLVFRRILHQAHPLFMCPRISVEAFDITAELDLRIILDRNLCDPSFSALLLHHLLKRHDSIVSAVRIASDDRNVAVRVLIIRGCEYIPLYVVQSLTFRLHALSAVLSR